MEQTDGNDIRKSAERTKAERKFVEEVKKAEKEIADGKYVTLVQLREYLGV